MFLILFILDDPEQCTDVLDAWEDAGASGATILPSTGLGRIRTRAGLKEDMPLMPSLEEFFMHDESQHRTLITVVKEREVVDRIVRATQRVVGDLNQPRTGILVVLPALEVYGLDRIGPEK